jgi:hypothetical protein
MFCISVSCDKIGIWLSTDVSEPWTVYNINCTEIRSPSLKFAESNCNEKQDVTFSRLRLKWKCAVVNFRRWNDWAINQFSCPTDTRLCQQSCLQHLLRALDYISTDGIASGTRTHGLESPFEIRRRCHSGSIVINPDLSPAILTVLFQVAILTVFLQAVPGIYLQ